MSPETVGLSTLASVRIREKRDLSTNLDTEHSDERLEGFQWSQTARKTVRANLNSEGDQLQDLIGELAEESGNSKRACWRFAKRMGTRSRRAQRRWTVAEQQRLIKLLDLHSIPEIAKAMRRSQSSIWHMLYRLGFNAKMGKDSFTKYSLACLLHVRPDTIETWINRGWLKTREVEMTQGKRIVIEAEDFCEFCRQHTKDVVGNRLNKERIDFVYRFAFPPSHAELLAVREAKKERGAYEEHINTDKIGSGDCHYQNLEDVTDSSDEIASA